MSFPEIYAQATDAGVFEDIGWEQGFDNIYIEQQDVHGYEEPSICTTQSSCNSYFPTAPVFPDLAQYNGFEFGYPQYGAVDELWNKSFTFKCPPAPPADPKFSSPLISPLTRLTIGTPSSLPSHESSILPTEQSAHTSKRYGYKPLHIAPTSWDIFQYNRFGELEPGRTYSTQELERYLDNNPQHHAGETYNRKLGGLTLWIQRTPPDSVAEYGHPEAGLCRFDDCEHNNVISAGEVRVAFDELTKLIPDLNPQHNAGYVHLSCLEKKMDLPKICKDLDVKPEGRVLPLERKKKNHMILQDRTELQHVQRFITFCDIMGRAPRSYPSSGYLVDEILKFGRSSLQPYSLNRWKMRGIQWDDQFKAKAKHAKDVLRVKRDGAWANMEKTRARAINRPRGSKRRGAPKPKLKYDDSITELDSKSEDDEASSRKRTRHAPKPRHPNRAKR